MLSELLDNTGAAKLALTPSHDAATFNSELSSSQRRFDPKDTKQRGWKEKILERFKALLEQYGKVVLVIHFAIYFAVIGVFFAALTMGFEMPGAENSSSLWLRLLGAYAGAKVLQPVRLLATVVLTPFVARILPGRKNTPDLPASEVQPPTANP